MVAARITDRKRKKIVADYLELRSINAAAKKNNVSWKKAKEAIDSDKELTKKLEQKKAQNTADVLAHMDGQKEAVCGLLDAYLEALGDPEKIARAGLSQLATTMGILIDKYTATVQNEQALRKLDEMLEKIGGVI